jgi:hypothetical protein
MSNLPNWNGADEAYRRAGVINRKLCYLAWKAAMNGAKGNYRKARKLYVLPEDVGRMIVAMDAGDEETMKALNHQYRDIWLISANA